MFRLLSLITIISLLLVLVYLVLVPPATQTTSMERSSGKPQIGGDFALTSHENKPVTNDSLKGKPRIMFFGFTHCPDICPIGLQSISQTVTAMGNDAPPAIFVTVDPQRDTVEHLKNYMENFPGILGLTGSQEQVKQAVKAYRVYANVLKAPEGNDPDDYNVDHSGYIYLMDAQGEYLAHFAHNAAPKDLEAGIRKHLF